jgi:hypothetical protein
VEQHKTHCAHCDRSDHSFKWFLEGTEFPHGCPRDFFLWAQSQGTTCAEMGFACTMKSATAEENEAPGGDSLGRGIQGQFFMGKWWNWWVWVFSLFSLSSFQTPSDAMLIRFTRVSMWKWCLVVGKVADDLANSCCWRRFATRAWMISNVAWMLGSVSNG